MKSMVCEMCGNNDIVKQDGLFVCQYCGTKYSTEDARKLFVEGVVKIDHSDELRNLYELARRAKATENNENAAKYYDMILLKDPSSWEANFYSVYYKTMQCKIVEISSAATNVSNCIKETFLLIRDNVSDPKERSNAVMEVRDRCKSISKMLFSAADSHMNSIDPSIKGQFTSQYLANAIAAGGIPKYVCDSICNIFINDEDVMRSVGIQILKDRIDEGIAIDAANSYVRAIQKYEPTYRPSHSQTSAEINQNLEQQMNSNSSSGGCYVATCVYGSYDCPEVWTLRRYRDYKLSKTFFGRTFIKLYYFVSPTIVKHFGHMNWFKTFWTSNLNKLVNKLNIEGYSNLPYDDEKW